MTLRTCSQLVPGTTKLRTLVAGWAVPMLAASMYVAAVSAQSMPKGYPQDWSHRHLVFSNPGTYEQAVQNGTVDKWLKITNDPRYIIQQRARSGAAVSGQTSTTPPVTDSASTKKGKIRKDWTTTLSGVVATLTGTVGTLSSSSISGSSTLTVDGVALSASAPTSATASGTFSSFPTSTSAPTLTVNGGGQTITLTTNATAKTATGTISAGAPLTGQTIVVPSNAGSISLTPGGNAATLTGSVSAAVSSGTIQLVYNNGGGTANTLSLTSTTQTQGKVVGTFTASGGSTGQFLPGETANTWAVTSAGTVTLTPNSYGWFAFSGEPCVGLHNPSTSHCSSSTGDQVTIGSNTYTFSTVTTGTRDVLASSAETAAQNLAAAIMADTTMCSSTPCYGTGTTIASVTASYDATNDITYIFNGTGSTLTITITTNRNSVISESGSSIAPGSNSCSGTTGTFIATATTSSGGASAAANIYSSLTSNSNSCLTSLGMTAADTALTVTLTNTAYGPTPAVSNTENLGGFAAANTQGTGSNGCTNSTTGTFGTYSGITTAIQASNIAAAITACDSSFGAVGATASYTSGTTFTVTAAAPGSAVTLGTGSTSATGFSWSGSTPGNDTGAGTCTSGTAGTFVNSGVADTLAANIYNTLISSSCTTTFSSGVTATHTANTNTVTVTADALGGSPVFTTTGSTATEISWGAITGGSAGTTGCTGSGPWTATFMTGTTTTATAANVTSAIQACTGASATITATGDSVVSTTVPGSGATLTVGATNSTNIFSWSSVTPGTDGTNSSTTFAYWSGTTYLTQVQVAANIASAINSNTTLQALSTGVSATSSGDTVTIAANTAGTGGNSYVVSESSFSAWSPNGDLSGGGNGSAAARVQPNTYPAKYSFSTTSASCTDFVVYPTGATGSADAANIIAYTNLYVSGCSGATPSAYWAYSTGGAVSTSPILSLDGSQIAYIQVSGTTASLVLLKWAANPSASVGTPLTLTAQASGSAYQSCSAPCMYSIAFDDGHNDTYSAPFYDYHDDTIYVGDDDGLLHQFTGVFNGSPQETVVHWPVSVAGASTKVSSPVYDYQSGNVIVGDFAGAIHSVQQPTGTPVVQTVSGVGDVIADAPLVDSSSEIFFVFVTTSGTYSETGDNAVYEFSTSFDSATLGTSIFPGVVPVGSGGAGYYLYAGTFDNVYYSSSSPVTGSLYVAGNTGVTGSGNGGKLYRIAITAASMAGVTTVATVTGTSERPWPSPVTEFCNPGTNSACGTLTQTVTGCTFATTSTTITCSGGGFTSSDVGASITGTNIPGGATISGFTSSTKVTISVDPSGNETGSGVSLTLGATDTGTDYVFFSVNSGSATGCTNSSGNGCVLAYNVSYPGTVTEAGSGLNVTTPGTNGCWATGGLVVDNAVQSGTLAGASQVYFVNLDANAAGSANGAASSGCTSPSTVAIIDGVQASQTSP